MELSKRLQAVADLIPPDRIVADVGTDHGYIPIWLVEQKKSRKVIALDINEGPLTRAMEHITGHGLGNYIETRRSDGLKELKEGEADCVVIAGMGGGLVMKIMSEGAAFLKGVRECILQPQSELEKVRQFLWQEGYCSVAEDMVLEDGKYYPMMRVIQNAKMPQEPYDLSELRYGRLLLKQRHPVLIQFLEKEITVKEQILSGLQARTGEKIRQRYEELSDEIACARLALQRMREPESKQVRTMQDVER